MIELIPASAAHTKWITDNLRDHDSFEFKIFGVDSNELELRKILKKSPYAYTAIVDDKPVCMWGLKEESMLTGAYIWLVTTPEIEDHVFMFLRESKRIVADLTKEYPLIYGYVDKNYMKSRRWLEWLGFKFIEELPFGEMSLMKYELRGATWQ